MSRGLPRQIRAIAGVIALVALLLVVNNWYREYRGDVEPRDRSVETTVTPDGDEVPDGDGADEATNDEEQDTEAAENGATVVVTIEGLNFRREPSTDAGLIRGLGRNDRLEHLETVDGWYRVRDSEGAEGYVSANPQYTRLEE